MNYTGEYREIALAHHMIETGDTVRGTAKHFGISKSTVHKDVTERLQRTNHALYLQVQKVLEKNKQERHIRGGIATRQKFLNAKKEASYQAKDREKIF